MDKEGDPKGLSELTYDGLVALEVLLLLEVVRLPVPLVVVDVVLLRQMMSYLISLKDETGRVLLAVEVEDGDGALRRFSHAASVDAYLGIFGQNSKLHPNLSFGSALRALSEKECKGQAPEWHF